MIADSEIMVNLWELVQHLKRDYPQTLNAILDNMDLSEEYLEEILDGVDKKFPSGE
jgi:hypothetical protein